MSHLLTANGIGGLIDAVQSNDPGAALRQVMGDSTMDLSEQRKLLIAATVDDAYAAAHGKDAR